MSDTSFYGLTGTSASVSNTIQSQVTAADTSAQNAAASETNAAASAAAASASATSSAAQATLAQGHAATALTHSNSSSASATQSATSATASAASATSSANSATASSTSASNSADSADDAEKLAINPEDSQYTLSDGTTTGYSALHYAAKAEDEKIAADAAKVAAQAAQAAAETAYDDFDDRYLGSKVTTGGDPTVDNDGNALVTGALFFDQTNSLMKVWTGSAWLVTYASNSGGLTAANNLSDLNNAATARSNLGLDTAAEQPATAFATAAQGTLAASAVQPGDNISGLTNDSGYITSVPAQSFASLTGKPTTISGYGITDAVFALNDLTDVSAASPTDGYSLTWNNTTSQWEASAVGVSYIDGSGTASATGGNALAIGSGSVADGTVSIAIGAGADTAGYGGTVALGYNATPTQASQLMLGPSGAGVGFASIRVGDTTYSPTDNQDLATKKYVDDNDASYVAGSGTASALGSNAVALGGNATASGSVSAAIGFNADTAGYGGSVALGYNATNTAGGQLMLGDASSAGFTSIRVGNTGYTPTDNYDLATKKYVDDNAAGSADINMGNNAVNFGTSAWSIELDTVDNDLNFKFNGTTVFKISSAGAVVAADDVTGFGTP